MRILTIILDYLSFLPPAFLCFLPMKDLLRYNRRKTLAIVGGAMLTAMLALGWGQYRFVMDSNLVLLPMLAVCFFAYNSCQRATTWQSLSILCASAALMSIMSNMAICSGALWFSREAGGGGTAYAAAPVGLQYRVLRCACLSLRGIRQLHCSGGTAGSRLENNAAVLHYRIHRQYAVAPH